MIRYLATGAVLGAIIGVAFCWLAVEWSFRVTGHRRGEVTPFPSSVDDATIRDASFEWPAS